MRIHSITYPDVNNGIGCRATLWVAGCSHHCKGCQNKQTWDFMGGKLFDESKEKQLFDIIDLPYIKGLTLSGGDPIDSYEDVLLLVKDFRKRYGNEKDIWLYTGYTLQQLIDNGKNEILNYIDYLVDGEYIKDLRDITLAFRGSSNQTIYERNSEDKMIRSKLNEG